MNKEELKEVIKEVVNGKIDALRDDVAKYRKEHQSHVDETKPILEVIRSISVGRKAIIWLTVMISAIGGSILIIKKLIDF